MNNREWLNTLSNEEFVNNIMHCEEVCMFSSRYTCNNECSINVASWLDAEHEEPDTQEKIDAVARSFPPFASDTMFDLLRRQRELDARLMGGGK